MMAQDLIAKFYTLSDEDASAFMTIANMKIIMPYLMRQAPLEEQDKFTARLKVVNAKKGISNDRERIRLYHAAGLNMDINYKAVYRADSVKETNFKLANLEPHQDYGLFYTIINGVRPFNSRDMLKVYDREGYDHAFIAWTDPELLKVAAMMLILGQSRAEVMKATSRQSYSVQEVNEQLNILGYTRGYNKSAYNHIGHFITKLIDIAKVDRTKSLQWNYMNATRPVRQPDLYFPYTGYRHSARTGLFTGVTPQSYAFYRCVHPVTGKSYIDRADEKDLFFCPQSPVMHHDMDMFIDLMRVVLHPYKRLEHPFIEDILDTFLNGSMQMINDHYDENLSQSPGNIVPYILALMGRFPEKLKPLDSRRELILSGPLSRDKWLTDPRLKYLLVYHYFMMEVIQGRPVNQAIASRSADGSDERERIMIARTVAPTVVNYTPKYDPYKYHADRSDEDTLLEVGDVVQRNTGGRTVVKLFNGVWEDEITKSNIWDVCTKHSLIEFSHKTYRARVDATKSIMNKSYQRPGLTHRPDYLDWPLALKDILPDIGIHRKRVHNIFNYVLKYHIEKHKIAPFKTNYCQIEERHDKIVLTAGLNRLNISIPQWIQILEYLRKKAFADDYSYIHNDRVSIVASNILYKSYNRKGNNSILDY